MAARPAGPRLAIQMNFGTQLLSIFLASSPAGRGPAPGSAGPRPAPSGPRTGLGGRRPQASPAGGPPPAAGLRQQRRQGGFQVQVVSSDLEVHDKSRVISKTLPEKHSKHCVFEKKFSEPVVFCKMMCCGI